MAPISLGFNVLLRFVSLLTLTIFCSVSAAQQSAARAIFNETNSQVYQIRVIDIGSGDKYAIGSGFSISTEGLIATNFHVISSYIHEPDKYRLEYIASDKSSGTLSVEVIDVIHDLAIVKAELQNAVALALNDQTIPKGERIFSMGNPNDLGMTIVEGNYNGEIEKSRYRKILFSGSLNSGMSGGPAFNENGEVIGVNVAKGGEHISFLVPVKHLINLRLQLDTKDSSSDTSYKDTITGALIEDQNQFYQSMLSSPFDTKIVDILEIPNELHNSLKCWGHTVKKDDVEYQTIHQHCRSTDQIYIDNRLNTGTFEYDVEYFKTSTLNRFQFYTLLEDEFYHSSFSNSFEKKDYEDFVCHDDLIELPSGNWKVSSCFRPYAEYKGLYDASMVMVSTDHTDKAALIRVISRGISSENALRLFNNIMGSFAWKH